MPIPLTWSAGNCAPHTSGQPPALDANHHCTQQFLQYRLLQTSVEETKMSSKHRLTRSFRTLSALLYMVSIFLISLLFRSDHCHCGLWSSGGRPLRQVLRAWYPRICRPWNVRPNMLDLQSEYDISWHRRQVPWACKYDVETMMLSTGRVGGRFANQDFKRHQQDFQFQLDDSPMPSIPLLLLLFLLFFSSTWPLRSILP
jgi:hypothetical protein